jgi:precorrin-6A synthase
VKQVSIIGIGAGDPDYVTVQAIKAMNKADVFFVVTKASEKQDLVDLRREILERYVEPGRTYRTVELRDPERRRGAPTAEYGSAVEDWRRQRADLYERVLRDELGDGRRGAFLAWGDPALYDSTLGVIEDVQRRGALDLDYEVVPGISSVQALAARHRIVLNRVGGAVHVTTGRRLAAGFPAEADDVVVMLDATCAFKEVRDEAVDIFWGAYLGTEDEILVSGPLAEVGDEIARVRAAAKERKGWMFDTYLLRRKR